MIEHFVTLCTGIALLVGVCRYLIGGIMRVTHPNVGVKKVYSYKPTISILLPCFNEGPAVYSTVQSIRESDYPQDLLEIIATDDCSQDDSFEYIQKAARDFPNVVAMKNDQNMGKTHTILNALGMSKAEIVIIVDSDTLLHPKAITELMACMGDKRLGGAGAIAVVRNANTNALTAFQAYIYVLGFEFGKVIENQSRCVGVIGGYCFSIRREIFESMRADLILRNWFGCKVKDGEDRWITHQILLRGWGTYMDMSAIAYTFVPDTFVKYWGQQLRWRRTTIRDFFFSVRRIPEHGLKLGITSLYVYLLTPIIVLISIINVAMIFVSGPLDWLDPRRAFIFIAYAFVALFLLQRMHPREALKGSPFRVMAYLAWFIANNLLLAPLALFTLDGSDWGNRAIKKAKEIQ